MIVDLPDTTVSTIAKKLVSVREEGGAVALGRVLTLVIVSTGGFDEEAIDAAKQMLQNSGGGELTVKGRDGVIRSKDTIPPGNDPNPPKDREH